MKKILYGLVALFVAGFAYWTITPLFINTEIDDTLPIATPQQRQTLEENTTDTPTLESPEDATNQTSEPTQLPESEPVTLFPIEDTTAHPATGNIRVVQTPDEQIIRFEDYDGTNGPDLRIYLASDLEASEFVDLGPARGNKGNINYSVPMDIDIDDYPYVLTWCRAFGVLFDYAKIN